MVSRHPLKGVLRPVPVVLLIVVLFSLGTAARAERPAAPQLLPDYTVAYVRVADAQETIAKFQETSSGRLLQDPQLAPFVKNLYGSAQEAFAPVQEELGLSLDQLLAIPQGEISVALVAPPMARPQLAAILEVKDQMPQVEKLLNRAFEEAGAQGAEIAVTMHRDVEITTFGNVGPRSRGVHLCTREGVVLVSTDLELMKQLLDTWAQAAPGPTLADNRRFTTIMAKSVGTKEERPQISWFVDPIAIFRAVGQGNAGAQVGLAFLAPLGLDGLQAVGGSIILAAEEFDAITHLHVLLESPRDGVLEMVALRNGDTTPEPWVPKDVASYMTLHWDFGTTFGELARMYDIIRLREGAFSDIVKQRVSRELGADFQQEILPALAGRVTMATRIQRPIRLNSESTIVGVQVRDAAAFQPIFQKFLDKQGERLTAEAYGTATYYKLPANRPADQPAPDEALVRQPQPALMMLGDYLLVTDNAELLEQCIVTRNMPGSSLAEDLEYKLVASRIERHTGDQPPGLLAFARPEENLRALYDLAVAEQTRSRLSQAANENPFFRALDTALTKHPLPPFEVIAKYLAPSGSMMVNDETGLHYISFGLRRE